MEINQQKKPIGFYRKEMYALFEHLVGRKMTEKEHELLKQTFMAALREHQTMNNPNPNPIEHRILCPKCQDLKVKVGKSFKFYKRKLKARGGDVSEQK